LNTLDQNLAQIDGMYRLLEERELAFASRSESLSLTDAQAILDRAKKRIAAFESALNADQISDKLLATNVQVSALQRLENAEARIVRINTERERQLSKKYALRVARLKGVLKWELSEAYPATRWQHQKQLNTLKVAYVDASEQYQQLKQLQRDTKIIDEQRSRVDAMALSAQNDYTRTKILVDSLTQRLTRFLQANMAERMQALADQQVATRLAIIRIQDLAQPGRGL
jgi:hypothetical protein